MIRPARMEGKTLENVSREIEKGKNDLRFKIYEKGPFNIHLKVKRPDIQD
jgi:predicted Ser/Thr protein kinase